MCNTALVITALATMTALCTSTGAQDTHPSPAYDWSTPLKASASFNLANQRHDPDAVKRCYHAATDDERKLLEVFDAQARAGADLHKSCLARFGRGLPRVKYDVSGEEAEVIGDQALVYPGGKKSGVGIRWVRVAGEWKMPMAEPLRVHLRMHKTLSNALKGKRAWTDQLCRVADEVRAGQYRSPEEVDKHLDDLAVAEDKPAPEPPDK